MPTESHTILQAGAVPLKDGSVCLVTSRSGKRWVIPKGIIDPGKTAGEIALQEAWEEAGLTGVLEPSPVGTYVYEKYGGTCHVTVFRMLVSAAADEWPEHGQRERVWLRLAEALEHIDDAGLRDIIRAAVARSRTQK
jgi:8-oxo-dGTP pyrophosphatase MutT (NUDIX family)